MECYIQPSKNTADTERAKKYLLLTSRQERTKTELKSTCSPRTKNQAELKSTCSPRTQEPRTNTELKSTCSPRTKIHRSSIQVLDGVVAKNQDPKNPRTKIHRSSIQVLDRALPSSTPRLQIPRTPHLEEVLLKAVVVSGDDAFCLPFEGDSVSRLQRVLWKSKMQQEQMKGTKKARNVEQKISPSTSFIFYNLSFVLIFFLSFLSRGECRGIPRIYISKREGEMAKRSKSPTKLKS